MVSFFGPSLERTVAKATAVDYNYIIQMEHECCIEIGSVANLGACVLDLFWWWMVGFGLGGSIPLYRPLYFTTSDTLCADLFNLALWLWSQSLTGKLCFHSCTIKHV